MSKKQHYALGLEVNGQLAFFSGIDTSGEKPNIKFTDDETEMLIDTNLEEVIKIRDMLIDRVDVEIVEVNFQEEESK